MTKEAILPTIALVDKMMYSNGELIANKYEVLEKIGEGAMGVVYRAYQKDVERDVAVKILASALAQNPEFHQRFMQEARTIARLSYSHIVNVIGIEKYKNTFCIIMELLEGESLQKILARSGRMEQGRAVNLALQVADALHYAHTKGIIHRDVKPDNIMVMEDDEVKVTDFGIARCAGSSIKTQAGVSMGTPKFMSPEQATGKKVDARTDIYSLGVVLFNLVTGHFPFDAGNIGEFALLQQSAPPRPSSFFPEILPALEAVILKAIQKNPEDRYESAMEMASALGAIAREISGEVPASSATVPPTPSHRGESTAITRGHHFAVSPPGERKSILIDILKNLRYIISLGIIIPVGIIIVAAIAFGIRTYLSRGENQGGKVATPTRIPPPTPGKWELARRYYKRAKALEEGGGSPAQIRKNYEEALKYEPDYGEALRDYGFFFYKRKEYHKAEWFLKRAREECHNPGDKKQIDDFLARIQKQTRP